MNTLGNISGDDHRSFLNGNNDRFRDVLVFSGEISSSGDLLNRVVKPDPAMHGGWSELGCGYGNVPGLDHMTVEYRKVLQGGSSSSKKKRKADLKVEDDAEDNKKSKMCAEGDSKITHENSNKRGDCHNKTKNSSSRETSVEDSSKETSKVSEVQKQDYIHVRARRGQATDSHSLAERVRREKISERMKYLQDLVPGCNKITGKAGMLDEIINYVQSLQRQVEFLSMKLATVNPQLDNLLTEEMYPSSTSEFPAMGCSSESANSAYFQWNSLEQMVSCYGLEMGTNPTDTASRPINTPLSISESFVESSCFNLISPDFSPSFFQL